LKKYVQAEILESFEAELEAKNKDDCLPFSAAPLLMLNSDCTHNTWFPPVSLYSSPAAFTDFEKLGTKPYRTSSTIYCDTT